VRKYLSHFKNAALAARLSYPPGHYYSPVCNPKELIKRYHEPSTDSTSELPGIDLNKDGQIARLLSWRKYLSECQFTEMPTPPRRYYFGGRCQYPLGDARSLHCFIRELNPHRIVEVGCGFSSACILDTIEQHQLDVRCTFIDPEIDRLLSLMHPEDRLRASIYATPVQDVPMIEFESLNANDILFIDSTHVLKTGSDVAFELFEILPRLKAGVLVHFHDVHFPFEYPGLWVIDRNYSWNEIYAVRALLMYSKKFKIEFWNSYLDTLGQGVGPGASLWLSVAG